MSGIFGPEGLEAAPGYDVTWSLGETLGASTALDEDYDTSLVTGAPAWWGDQCLRASSLGNDVYVRHDFGSSQPLTFWRTELVIGSESLSDGGEPSARILGMFNASEQLAWDLRLIEDASGDIRLRLHRFDNGSFPSVLGTTVLSLSTVYRVEVMHDTVGDAWEVQLDGTTEISGSYTAPRDAQIIRLGLWNAPAMEIFFDNILIDDADWPGPVVPPAAGAPYVSPGFDRFAQLYTTF